MKVIKPSVEITAEKDHFVGKFTSARGVFYELESSTLFPTWGVSHKDTGNSFDVVLPKGFNENLTKYEYVGDKPMPIEIYDFCSLGELTWLIGCSHIEYYFQKLCTHNTNPEIIQNFLPDCTRREYTITAKGKSWENFFKSANEVNLSKDAQEIVILSKKSWLEATKGLK